MRISDWSSDVCSSDLPNPGPDGQFATVNSGIGPQETIWHLRAALNVAALACGDGKAITSAYNRFLADRKQVLKKAWAAETSQHGRATMDRHMTLLYNYFAQPPEIGRATVRTPVTNAQLVC